MLLPRHVRHVSPPSKAGGLHLTAAGRGLLLSLLGVLVVGGVVFSSRVAPAPPSVYGSGGGGAAAVAAIDLLLAAGGIGGGNNNARAPPDAGPTLITTTLSLAGRGLLQQWRGLDWQQQQQQQQQPEEVAAMAVAAAAAASPPAAVCALPPAVVGRCRGAVPRWSFDPQSNRCEPFTWGGCGDEQANRFDQLQACRQACERGAGVVSAWPPASAAPVVVASPSPSSSPSPKQDKSINVTTLPSEAVPPLSTARGLIDETEEVPDKGEDAAPALAPAPASSAAGDGGRAGATAAALAIAAAAAAWII